MKSFKNNIEIVGAREKNLKSIDISIPKGKITVVTGVSGSGKSALVFDTIAAESQLQLNKTYSSFIRHRLPHYGEPEVDAIENLSVAIIIDQKRIGGNARSTVGTITDIYSLLRLLFSRRGKPFVGYSKVFSFNNPEGMCPKCDGLGIINKIDIERLIDQQKSLNEGAIKFPTFRPGQFRWKRYVSTGLFDNDKKIKDYTEEEWDTLLYKKGFKPPNPTDEWPPTSEYEGIIPRIERSFLKKETKSAKTYKDAINYVVTEGICPLCNGGRLNQEVLECKINDKNIADCSKMQVNNLIDFISTINSSSDTVEKALIERLEDLISIGLGYLSLDRDTSSLSGGESQRIKMVRQLGSSLTDITYILDEPSIGLHPHDICRIKDFLKKLRDKGNTVIIVEHDPDIIKIADYIIDMGPEAGTKGGRVVYEGDLKGLEEADTLTAKFLNQSSALKEKVRKPGAWFNIKNASLHNLKDINVKIPKKVMIVVTGVAGSGKSTLINQVFTRYFPETIVIDQKGIQGTKRSNIATYSGILDIIRKLFADKNNVSISLFSFNSEGACPECNGLGKIYTDMAFMDTVTSVCEACQGDRFNDEAIQYKYQGKNIAEVLKMTVDEAIVFFSHEKILSSLKALSDVGIGYITLGQTLDTLSGGELQRVKLATELENSGNIYVLDEPTTGLHMSDIEQLNHIFNRLVDQGNTVIVIEHNLDIISKADWIIDLGPGAGEEGGRVIFEGCPREIIKNGESSFTGKYLREYIKT
ncbi:ATP-binding cassette domain-containing protein [Iocasia frigidifontis]|uniref:UvrABC system protein A n=1 Tax=Iocasia fonsfrigidae TaxID=2682810 RepID=A0A8A7KF49_9FIRM|nr:excinuclease ABC subunit UvrA [Iocasia fonsfrigidae]QTL97527.1 ATP-binding cassette domain-containing protein [Iocasia fonsfrigidae]